MWKWNKWIPIAALIVMVTLSGCTASPYATATDAADQGFAGEVVELQAFALYGTFTVAEEALARVIVKPGISEELKASMKAADLRTKNVADPMNRAGKAVAEARAALFLTVCSDTVTKDCSTVEDFAAVEALSDVVTQRMRVAKPEIDNFTGLVRAFQKQGA